MNVKPLKTTDKEYQCVQCGSENVSIIREDKQNARLKCNACKFLFDASDAENAEKAGAIPDSSPEALATASDPEVTHHTDGDVVNNIFVPGSSNNIPRTPSYVFISKDRKRSEFSTTKTLRKVALQWEASGINYDCFQLLKKESVVELKLQ